ncbi:MAG: hypothetical protein GWP91_25560 [Rhodobacterales bacterium]|nr:hypothetical protein [Rhodobacterales bacterium]
MPNMMMSISMAVVFTAVLSIVQGLYWAYVARQERETQEKLRRLTGGAHEVMEATLIKEQEEQAAAKALGSFGEKIQNRLLAADSSSTVMQVIMQILGAGFLGTVVGLFMFGAVGFTIGLVAASLPYMFLGHQATSRSNELVSQLPEALDLMSRSLQAGMGLNDTFRLVAEEMPVPVATEFGRVFEEVRFGRDYRDAFAKMIERNPGVFDLRLMVSSILLQRETGGNLIEILENISSTIRARFGFQHKVAAMTSEAKFTAGILAALPLAVMTLISISSPDYLSPLFTEPMGQILAGFDILLYVAGIFIMVDMTKVEV